MVITCMFARYDLRRILASVLTVFALDRIVDQNYDSACVVLGARCVFR